MVPTLLSCLLLRVLSKLLAFKRALQLFGMAAKLLNVHRCKLQKLRRQATYTARAATDAISECGGSRKLSDASTAVQQSFVRISTRPHGGSSSGCRDGPAGTPQKLQISHSLVRKRLVKIRPPAG